MPPAGGLQEKGSVQRSITCGYPSAFGLGLGAGLGMGLLMVYPSMLVALTRLVLGA